MKRSTITSILAIMVFCLADLSGASAKNWNTGKKQQSSNGISDIKQIIIGDMGKGYDFEKRNVASKEALKILKHQGMLAAKFKLSSVWVVAMVIGAGVI